MGIKTVPHPPYCPDLAPGDFCLFPKLRGCRYEINEEMKEAVTKVIDTLTQEDFHGAFQKLFERYNKCIAAGGDCFKGDLSSICVLSINVLIRKKTGNLFNDPCINVSLSFGRILVCAYTIWLYGQILMSSTILSISPSLLIHVCSSTFLRILLHFAAFAYYVSKCFFSIIALSTSVASFLFSPWHSLFYSVVLCISYSANTFVNITDKTILHSVISKYKGNQGSLILVRILVLEKKTIDFWPVKIRLKIDSILYHLLKEATSPHYMVVDKFTYLGSSVSFTEKDINTRLTKTWSATDNLSVKWKSDLTDKIKRSFYKAAVVSILLYGCTTRTLTKHMEEKLYSNYARLLWAILNKFWRQHLTKQQLFGHRPAITKTIQVRRTRYAGHCWKNKDELISNLILWTPSHGRARVWRPSRTGCRLEDLSGAMDDRDEWREWVRGSVLMARHDVTSCKCRSGPSKRK